jgi:hypothetical protein
MTSLKEYIAEGISNASSSLALEELLNFRISSATE